MKAISEFYKVLSEDPIWSKVVAGIIAAVLISVSSKLFTWLTSRSYKAFWFEPIPVSVSFELNRFGVATATLVTGLIVLFVPFDSNFWLVALTVLILVMLLFAAGILIAIRDKKKHDVIEILSATYVWENGQRDVTQPVRNLVTQGITTIMVDPSTFGIPDPARRMRKTLKLHCRIDGKERVFNKDDGERFHLQ